MRESRLLFGAASVLALVVSACSGSSSSSVSASDACAQAVDTLCQKIDSCGAFFLQVAYTDVATCKTRVLGNCVSTFSAPNEGNTPERLQACAAAAKDISCGDLFANNLPKDCQPVAGTAPTGAACGDDSQCQTAFCGNGSDICASCSVPPAEGGACVNGKCPSGLDCVDNLCIKRGASGDSCAGGKPCRTDLVCADGTCKVGGKAGDACDPQGQGTPCSLVDGFFCNPASSKCEAVKIGAAGEACGYVDGSGVLCNSSTYCKKDAPTAVKGLCVARAQDGAACSDNEAQGAPCMTGAKCSDGICKVPDAAACK